MPILPQQNEIIRQSKAHDKIWKWTKKTYIKLYRVRCPYCNTYHRVISSEILPYKQYKSVIIYGFVNDILSSDMAEYEDFPSDETIERWRKEFQKNSQKGNFIKSRINFIGLYEISTLFITNKEDNKS